MPSRSMEGEGPGGQRAEQAALWEESDESWGGLGRYDKRRR